MKRILSLLLVLAMMFCLLCACGTSGNTSDVSGNDGGSAPADNSGSAPADNSGSAPADNSGSGSAPAANTSGAFKIGGIGPLTGGAAIYGTMAMNAAQIAVDEINAKGGIQIEFNAQDDEHDTEKSVNAYNNLKDWGMQILVGTVTTGPALSVTPECFKDRVFALTPSASSADVTAGKDNVFQMCFTDPNQGIASADYMADNMADSKIAIIYKNDDAYSSGVRDAFVAEAGKKNLEIVYEGTFTEDTATDFNVQLTGAQSAGADLVFLPIYYTPASVIFSQAAALNYAPTFFGIDGMDGILAMEGFDTSLAEGVMLLTPFSPDEADSAAFTAAYQEKYGETPNQFAADGYDCVYAIYDALTKSGCTPDMSASEICDKLIETFTSSDFVFNGRTGKDMTWNAQGEVSKAPVAYVIKDGKYVNP